MDTCFISYIFTRTTGYRIPFSKDSSIQVIGNCLRKYGGKRYIILFRFNNDKEKSIIMTLWIPSYCKIGELVYPNWFQHVSTYPKDTILVTPRGEFEFKDVNKEFFHYCKIHHKIIN